MEIQVESGTVRLFKPWREASGRTTTAMAGRCLHYYFSLMDEGSDLFCASSKLGATRLQVYLNQQQWLARQLSRKGIEFPLLDHAFIQIDG